MAHELTPIDVSLLPELAHLADEVQRTRTIHVLRRDNQDLAIVMPAVAPTQTSISQTVRPLSEAERVQMRASLTHLQAHRQALIAERGDLPLTESWPLIREERDRRSQD